MFVRRCFAIVALMLLAGAAPVLAQGGPSRAPTSRVEVTPLPSLQTAVAPAETFDADKATNAYLATVSGEARAKSDAYFEGGYYLQLVDVLYALAVSALLLWSRTSAWMRNRAMKTMFMIAGASAMLLKKAPDGLRNGTVRFFMSPGWQTAVYAVLYVILTTVLTFPLAVYEEFFREHAYGLSNQNFMQWFGEFAIGFGLQIVLATLALCLLYAVIRRAPKTWWAWAVGLFVIFAMIGQMIEPVFIEPLFNTYKSLPESPLKEQILSQARASGVPATDVFVFDASKQTKRISANVAGFAGTTRIALNDNLLNRTNHGETLAVLGHEMGHYVLDHGMRIVLWLSLIVLIGLLIANWGFKALVRVYGARWDVRGIDDPAGLPVLAGLAMVLQLLFTPAINTVIRTTEAQADIFGLNAARQPDGFATVTVKLSEYRKLDPSPLEEFVFYDHPSGRSRVSMSMRWKAEHLNDADIKAGPKSPQ